MSSIELLSKKRRMKSEEGLEDKESLKTKKTSKNGDFVVKAIIKSNKLFRNKLHYMHSTSCLFPLYTDVKHFPNLDNLCAIHSDYTTKYVGT
jgi:hypothetical protein